MSREPNVYESSFPSEIVTCRLGTKGNVRLLCKYEAGRHYAGYGHWGSLHYEADVYRRVLQPLSMSAPHLVGSYQGEDIWLFLEYLDDSSRIDIAPSAETLPGAARWAGRFHALNEHRLSDSRLGFLTRYDAEFYRGWATRTAHFAGDLHRPLPWLDLLCSRFEDCVATLLAPPLTIIHGEYTVHNILVRNGTIFPIDWQSAAVAAGEIDLACLLEGWSDETVEECIAAYHQARWPDGAPASFDRRFAAAQLYLHFRWLGDQPEWTVHESRIWRFQHLRPLGERLGLL
ncbi:MAG TPA: phosphotransferase [Chloroflexota bacterium]|nr:phosphotransferase [Chloroflexota bacterium]